MSDSSKVNLSTSPNLYNNIKELFPAQSRKIDILEQRLAGYTGLSNDADIEDKVEEEVLDDSEDEDVCNVLEKPTIFLPYLFFLLYL